MTDKSSRKSYAVADRERFSELVDTYYDSLIAFSFRILGDWKQAEDTVQDVFVKLWVHRRKFDADVSLKNYLYVSTRNAAYNYIRSSKRKDAHIRNISPPDDATLSMIEEESNRILRSAIEQLSYNCSEVIRLSLDGLAQDEIARTLGIALPTVKALKAKAIKQLRKIIDELSR